MMPENLPRGISIFVSSQCMVRPARGAIEIREMERGMDNENVKGRENSRCKSQRQRRKVFRGTQVFHVN